MRVASTRCWVTPVCVFIVVSLPAIGTAHVTPLSFLSATLAHSLKNPRNTMAASSHTPFMENTAWSKCAHSKKQKRKTCHRGAPCKFVFLSSLFFFVFAWTIIHNKDDNGMCTTHNSTCKHKARHDDEDDTQGTATDQQQQGGQRTPLRGTLRRGCTSMQDRMACIKMGGKVEPYTTTAQAPTQETHYVHKK